MDYLIREAEISDAKAIHDIYGYYVENTYVTFSEENPSVGEYEEKILNTFIQAGQKIEAGEFPPNPLHCETCAFRNSCEKSVCQEEETTDSFSASYQPFSSLGDLLKK